MHYWLAVYQKRALYFWHMQHISDCVMNLLLQSGFMVCPELLSRGGHSLYHPTAEALCLNDGGYAMHELGTPQKT